MMKQLAPLFGLLMLVSQAHAQGLTGGGGLSNTPFLQRYTTANLPTCTAANAGALAMVTDGTTGNVGTTIAGSSNSTIIVACSSAGNWVVN